MIRNIFRNRFNRYKSLSAISDLPAELRDALDKTHAPWDRDIYAYIYRVTGLDINDINASEFKVSHKFTKSNIDELGDIAFILVSLDNEKYLVISSKQEHSDHQDRSYFTFNENYNRYYRDIYYYYNGRNYANENAILKILNNPEAQITIYTVDTSKMRSTKTLREERSLRKAGRLLRYGVDRDYNGGHNTDESGYELGKNMARYKAQLEKLHSESPDNETDKILNKFAEKLNKISFEQDLRTASKQLKAFAMIEKDLYRMVESLANYTEWLNDAEESNDTREVTRYRNWLYEEKRKLKELFEKFDEKFEEYKNSYKDLYIS